jgi:hypothetical protein
MLRVLQKRERVNKGGKGMDSKLFKNFNYSESEEDTSTEDKESEVDVDNAIFLDAQSDNSCNR